MINQTDDKWGRELKRKSLHMGLGVFSTIVLLWTSISFLQFFLTILLLGGLVLAILARVKLFPILEDLLGEVHRPHELFPGESAFIFILGILLPTLVFQEMRVVLIGILAVTFQDGFSTLFGIRWGKIPLLPGKTIEGSFAGWVAAILAFLFFLPWPFAVLLASVATLVELLPFNDSLTVPLVTAFAAQFLLSL